MVLMLLCCARSGYDIGATSGALVSLKSAATSGTTWWVTVDTSALHCMQSTAFPLPQSLHLA